jgi:tetratricopeptide (TPR) repeat protein
MNRAQRRNGETGKAEQTDREAIARDPHSFDAANNLERGQISEATAQFLRARTLRPNDARIVVNLARAYSAQNQFHDAAALFQQAVELDPRLADAQFGLALALSGLGKHGEAEPFYVRTLQLDPLNYLARIHYGLALAAQGKIAEAYLQSERLVRAETAPGFPHKNFGILLARINCPDGARACFETHLLHHPDDADDIAMLLATIGGTPIEGLVVPEKTQAALAGGSASTE